MYPQQQVQPIPNNMMYQGTGMAMPMCPQQNFMGQPQLSSKIGATRSVSSVEWGPKYEERHGACKSYLDSDGAWCPLHQNKFENQYLLITLPRPMQVTQILTKGKDGCNWVTRIRVSSIVNGVETVVGEFNANSDNTNVVAIPVNFQAQAVKIMPIAFHDCIDFRCDIMVM